MPEATMNNHDKVIAILDKTNDGRSLHQTEEEIARHGRNGDGWQLHLLQTAANNKLNSFGQEVLDKLYECVMAGDFAYSYQDFKKKFFPTEGTQDV